jgi:hypothetical protein
VNRFYIYCHRRLTDGKCFYIGKGTGNRWKSSHFRNQYWKNIVNKCGFEPIILVNNISEQKAFELESYFCNQIGYKNLANLNQEKGNGAWSRSQETKDKISQVNKGRKITWDLNHTPRSNSTKEKIGKSNSKPVLQFDKQENFIREWPSAIAVKKEIKIDPQWCVLGKRKTAGGYKWKYK